MPPKPSTPSTWKHIKEHVPAGTKIISLVSLVLILLKLFKVPPVANWSWWWILSPYWLAAAGGLVIMLGMFAVFYFFDR
jgi:membrane protein YdbS with pleckstrin-like domain